MTTKPFSIIAWLISLFDPPPKAAMTQMQKLKHIFAFVTTLLVISVLSSLLAASGIYILEHVYRWSQGYKEWFGDIGIIFIGMTINTLCVLIILEFRKPNRKQAAQPESAQQEVR